MQQPLRLVSLGAILVIFCATPILAAPTGEKTEKVSLPAGTLTSPQIKKLFTDKTVSSITVAKKRESLSYYAPDGTVHQLIGDDRRLGKWRVTDNGRICLQMENLPEKCRVIVKDRGVYKKYIVKKNGRHEHTITYKEFKKGNQLQP